MSDVSGSRKKRKRKVLLFTWNINGREKSLSVALSYLKRKTNFIGVLQELPEGCTLDAGANLNVLERHENRLLVLASKSIVKRDSFILRSQTSQKNGRLLGVRTAGPTWANLLVVGAHMVDKRSLPEPEFRCQVFSKLSDDLFKQFNENEDVVILGDFNANPFEHTICSQEGFWAIRNRDEMALLLQQSPPVQADSTDGSGIRTIDVFCKSSPFFNPMWKHLPEQLNVAKGTYRYRNNVHFTGMIWHWFDQILLSMNLVKKHSAIKILSTISNQSLVIKSRTTGTQFTGFGDHLPVEMTLTI